MPYTDMGAVVQMPTPNYSPSLIRHSKVVLHRTEGGTAAGAAAWLCRLETRAGVHLISDGTGRLTRQLTPLQFKSWGQCDFNAECISIEYPGYTKNGVPDELLHVMARDVSWLLRAYNLPTTFAEHGIGDGWCDHHTLGVKGGGHTDICEPGDGIRERLQKMIDEAYAGFLGDLPVWALHGLPNPHTVSLPPEVTPESSHGGQARIGTYDAIKAHPTVSGYPEGSIADLQIRLRMAGANPELAVDGDEGAATRAAIGVFQKAEGLPVTNDTNPATWAALVRITG